MPKLKTKSSAKKRNMLTETGKQKKESLDHCGYKELMLE